MTDLTYKTKKAAIETATLFAERNKEGYCVLPLLDGHSLKVVSYRLISFSNWIKECQDMKTPITVAHYVRY